MRWWLRLIVTLALTPLLWQLVRDYLGWQQGTTPADIAAATPTMLAGIYIVFTLPALVLCGAILTASDYLLGRFGLALFTVAVSPLLAWAVARVLALLLPPPYGQVADGAIPLLIVYGLIWGLTIREPRARQPARRSTAAPETGVPPQTLTEA